MDNPIIIVSKYMGKSISMGGSRGGEAGAGVRTPEKAQVATVVLRNTGVVPP